MIADTLRGNLGRYFCVRELYSNKKTSIIYAGLYLCGVTKLYISEI